MTDAVSSHRLVPLSRMVGSSTWLPLPFVAAGNSPVRAASAAAICCAVMEAAGEADAPGSPVAATITSPRMPPSAWPGTEQMKVRPPLGIVTSPVATEWASAEILVPSAKVRS